MPSTTAPRSPNELLRVAFLSTHPIQYHTPLFRQLVGHKNLSLEVLYCHQATPREQAAAGFGRPFEWDIPLLDGYPSRFLKNVSHRPSIATFAGLDVPEIKNLISERRFDAIVVHGWHYKGAWQAIWSSWKARVPVLVRSDSHLHTPRQCCKLALKWPFYRWAIPKFNACLPVGKWARDYFLHYGADPSRIFVVPHCVDSMRLSSEADQLASRREELRQRWNLHPDEVVWLFAGKFISKKRPLDFVRAVHRANQKGARVTGLMVGDGPEREACESFARQHTGSIRFAGFLNQTEISQAYVAADGLALPSDGAETWGLVVNEAMICGRPCIISDRVGCGPDLIEEGQTGAIFPVGDIESFANALNRYSNPAMLRRMGYRAQSLIQRHSPSETARQLVSAVRSTVSGTQGGACSRN